MDNSAEGGRAELHDDEREIVNVTVRYATALDDRCEELLLECFTPDADLDYGRYGHRTYDTIVESMRRAHAGLVGTQHRLFNHVVKVDNSRAQCRCYFEAVLVGDSSAGSRIRTLNGRYEDELIRTEDGWRISARHVVLLYETTNNVTTVEPTAIERSGEHHGGD